MKSSPLVEEEYKQVTRDHETALEFYNTLLKKMNESSMATALEHRQQGEQFSVMDAPNLPDAPTSPNRIVFAGGGLAAGLFLGLLIRRCSSIAILPCAMRGTFGPSPNCRLWP